MPRIAGSLRRTRAVAAVHATVRPRMMVLMAAVAAGIGCSGTGLPSPNADLNTGQALMDLNESIVQLREDNALIQAQVDSLRDVLARQDTVLRQIALQVGISVPPPR